MRTFWAGFVAILVPLLAALAVAAEPWEGSQSSRSAPAPPRLSGDPVTVTGVSATATPARTKKPAGRKPGTGAGWARQEAALQDGLTDGDPGPAFRRHAAKGIYGMQSAAGDRAVARLVASVKRRVGNGSLRSAEAVDQAMDAGLAALDDDGYGHVYDTVVRDHIYEALESSMRRTGMDPDALDLG